MLCTLYTRHFRYSAPLKVHTHSTGTLQSAQTQWSVTSEKLNGNQILTLQDCDLQPLFSVADY